VVIQLAHCLRTENNKFLFPKSQEGKQIRSFGFQFSLVGMRSGLALAFQVQVVNNDPAARDDERRYDRAEQSGFWRTYSRLLPWCLLLFGVSGYICYRHGRWVGSGDSHK